MATVRYLIEKQKCDVHSTDYGGWNAVHYAANTGQLDMLKYLLEEINMDKNASNTSSELSPVCIAACKGHIPVVDYLLKIGSQVRDRNYGTLLHRAVEYGHLDLVKHIMNDPDLSSMYFLNSTILPVHIAIKKGHLNIFKYLVKKKHSNSCFDSNLLNLAAVFGQVEMVKFLTLEEKCDHFARDSNDMTTLHYAAQSGQVNIVKYLAEELKCDPTIPGVIHLAAQAGELKMVKYLVQEQTCNFETFYCGKMPIHYAARNGKVNVVKYFVEELKCDPMVTATDQNTPLDYAASCGHFDIVTYLIARAQSLFSGQR